MGVGSGLGGQLGLKAETVYGTPVTVTTFLPLSKEAVTKGKNVAQATGLAAGRLQDLASGRVVTTHDAKGTITCDLASNGFGQLLQALMGTSVTPVIQGATAAYLQTHILADPVGKSLTVQVGVPTTDGTVRPFTYQGVKVTGGDFSFDINATTPVQSVWTVDAQDVTETPALAAASYVAAVRPFVGTDVTIKVGVFGAEASVNGVTKVDVKIPRPLNIKRFYFGALGVKAEPLLNDQTKIAGTITADFVDKTIWADRFASDAGFSLVVEAKGALIAGTYFQTFRITLPGCFLDGDTPVLDGPDVVNGAFPFTCLYDGTNLPTIVYISTDVTL